MAGWSPTLPDPYHAILPPGEYGVALFAFGPFFMGLAALRYRLFDVDRALRLTVTWSLITATHVMGYVALVVMASCATTANLCPEFARDPTLAVLAGLAVAALANPFRLRAQAALD